MKLVSVVRRGVAGPVAVLTYWVMSVAAAQTSCPASLIDQPIGFDLSSLDAASVSSGSDETALRVALDRLINRAESHLTKDLLAVTDKPAAGPSGDKKDYLSVAPYWWPDPQKTDGLPYIRRDGYTNPERNSNDYDRVRMQKMIDYVVDLSLAAYMTGRRDLAARAEEQLRVWFIDPDTRMNPNLRYAQAIPGRVDGRAIGIIDSRVLADIVDSSILLKQMNALSPDTEAGLKSWIGAFAAWLIESDFGQEERAKDNNHGTFYDAQLAHFLIYAGRCDLVSRVLEDTKARTVAQIKSNGIQPHEAKRTRSLHYHAFNLEAFLRLALIANRMNIDLYQYELAASGSIDDAVDAVAKYAGRFDEWPYPRLDEKGTQSVWLMLMRAQHLDPEDQTIATALTHFDGQYQDSLARILFFRPVHKD